MSPRPQRDHRHLPDAAAGCPFFPTCPSASTRVFGKETKRAKRSGKPEGEPSQIKKTSADSTLKNILISSGFPKRASAPPAGTPRIPEHVRLPHLPLARSRAYTVRQSLIDLSARRPTLLPRTTPVQAQAQTRWFGHLQQSTAVLLNITHFPGSLSLPPPVLPRKPRRQSEIGMCMPTVVRNNRVKGSQGKGEACKWRPL